MTAENKRRLFINLQRQLRQEIQKESETRTFLQLGSKLMEVALEC
jgi:hypothetical protein